MDQDVVRSSSDRICGHMNRDHNDAVEHLVMYYAQLSRLPKWSCMETIDRNGICIRYRPRWRSSTNEDLAELPVVTIQFTPPLIDTTDARKRLIELSEMSQAANRRRMDMSSEQNLCDRWNVEVLLTGMDAVIMHPITLGTVLTLAFTLFCSAQELWSLVMTLNFATQFHACNGFAQHGVLVMLWVCMIVYTAKLISWTSHRWRNAAPIPKNSFWSICGWAWRFARQRPLPRLDSHTWSQETVVITGGARGLGAEVALQLADKGAQVITLDVVSANVKHKNLIAYHCDVSKQDKVQSVSRDILAKHRPPTILINNAAIRNGRPLLALSQEDIARLLHTNLMAHFWTLKEFLPGMVQSKRGHIVTISSMMGETGVAQMLDYVASKHGLVGLHSSLRHELDAIYHTPFVRTTLVTTGHLKETSLFSGIAYNQLARFLAPTVSIARVSDALVLALESQESCTIVLPWYAAWTPVLRIMPTFVTDAIQCMLGANHSMSTIVET
ncbi:hypothetical protein MYAM1_003393 [Malassezia yamatoensis]|uniref:DUF2470 domain-containing protein n=1 Tax=Malassezia yamatoensis TaxID=253288 RepID=A0AAJ5YXQ3_9BASI|nr:hypothetical protein MYAM1_003393 [Malassezia yamatoensis]